MEATEKKPINLNHQGSIFYEKRMSEFSPDIYKKATMSDEQIHSQATKQAIDSYKNSPLRNIATGAVVAYPVADSFVQGAMTKSNKVAVKAKRTMDSMKNWGVFIGASMLLNKAADAVIEKIPPLKKAKEENPNTVEFGTVMGSALAAFSLVKPADELMAKAAKTNLGGQIKQSAMDLIKKTPLNKPGFKNFINKNMFEPVGNFMKKHPNAHWAGPLALLGGIVAANSINIENAKKKQIEVSRELQMERFKNQLEILKNTNVEKAEIHLFNEKA